VYASVYVLCRVKEGFSRSERLVGYFYSVPPLDMAHCLAKSGLALIEHQPWLALIQRPPLTLPHLSASAHVRTANILTLLIQASAMVTVYRGHRQTLFFLPRIISLFIVYIGIIRNNSLIGGLSRAEAWTPATECVKLYCTWRPSALTTEPHGQVVVRSREPFKFWWALTIINVKNCSLYTLLTATDRKPQKS